VPEDSTENHKKPLRIASLQAKIWTQVSPNTNQECMHSNQGVRFHPCVS
jgi:hypothetical protein